MTEKIQNFFLSCRECILENPRNFYGSFSLGPFKNSQSLTVANALRRTLLAELSGVAITHLEIEGVTHEYSTLLGIRESVLDLLLNFKTIVLKTTSPLKKPVFGYLSVRGPGIVRVSDLKLPPMIQCIDPDQYIATLNENGMLYLKFRISDLENSQKYPNSEDVENFTNQKLFCLKDFKNSTSLTKFHKFKSFQKKFKNFAFATFRKNGSAKTNFGTNASYFTQQKTPPKHFRALQSKAKTKVFNSSKTNALWVDPLFNPILKVNYVIETIEPMQKNIPNQIIFIELWTNGSIHPRKAFYESLLYLKTIFDKLDCMRFLNYSFTNAALLSDKTNTKFLKSFEYDYHFYNFLNKNKNSNLTQKTLFLPKEIGEVEKDYVLDLINKSHETWNTVAIDKLNLPQRITKILEKNNFVVVGDLLKFTPKELKTFPGIGNFCVCILQKRLKKLGLQLGSEKAKME